MDEPTVGIDPKSRNNILQSVKKLRDNGASIIYTSHYMEEIEEICDRICILDKGKIVAEGSSNYLKSNFTRENIYTIVLKNKVENIEKFIMKIDGIENISINDKVMQCIYSKDKNILQKLVNTIFNNGGVIESIKNESPTLENLFLNLTGKRLKN